MTTVRLEDESYPLPSDLLKNEVWRANSARFFNLDAHTEVSEETMAKVDLLVQLLRGRFKTHLRKRIKEKSRRTHWSMQFAYKNLSTVAAVMAMQQHLKENLRCLSEDDCMLAFDIERFDKCTDHPDRQGAYLYYDTNRGVMVRSGKVVGRGFAERHDEHSKCAKAKSTSSHFYSKFLSLDSPRANSKGTVGSFESLLQVVAVGFDPTHEVAQYLDRDVSEGGLLILDEGEKRNIKSSMKNMKCADITKFHHMIAYQMELGYDLAMCVYNNLSKNPGFEAVLGVVSDD